MGFARGNADPQPAPNSPGDSLVANDISPDGWAVEAELSTGRIASTRGHRAIYIAVDSGNLPEGHPYKLRGCIVKGGERKCTPWTPVHAGSAEGPGRLSRPADARLSGRGRRCSSSACGSERVSTRSWITADLLAARYNLSNRTAERLISKAHTHTA
ncbi:hypothetical protein [Streptomyces sp. NPDC059564]|uniref:hypothetical protein n=1 Tax=Streptomyces sp. NPDC059564 TaxID=3346865 RepID=UPI0036832D72